MNYDDLVKDFAARTRKNLEIIEQQANNPSAEAFEVTQLINSMLGLLVFPQQRYMANIPETSIEELEKQGWPKIRTTSQIQQSPDYRPCLTLRALMVYLRNAISHFNMEFLTDEMGQINGLRVWNVNLHGTKTWEADLSLSDLKAITDKFIGLLEGDNAGGSEHAPHPTSPQRGEGKDQISTGASQCISPSPLQGEGRGEGST